MFAVSIRSKRSSPHEPRAFTVPEMLAVVAIMAIMLAILLPSFSKARYHARHIKELSAAKQVGIGFIRYSVERLGRIIPGYAQEPARDTSGNAVNWPVSGRYPWRLAQYMDHHLEGGILVNEQEYLLKDPAANAYAISLSPTLGMNMYHVGGDLISGLPKFWIEKRHEAHSPSRMITFASARSNIGIVSHGFFRIEAPSFSFNSPAGWLPQFKESDSAHLFGFVHPRWDGRAVVSHMDAHADSLNTTELRDMTRWSNDAAKAGSPNWKP